MTSDRPGDEVAVPRIGVLPRGSVKIAWQPASRRTMRIATSIAVLAIFGLILLWIFRGSPFGALGSVGLFLGVVLPLVTGFAWILRSASHTHHTRLDLPDEHRIPELPAWSRRHDRALVHKIQDSFIHPSRPLEGRVAIVHESIAAIVGLDPDDRLLEEEPLIQEGDVRWPLVVSMLALTPMIGIGIVATASGVSSWSFLPFLVIVGLGQLPQINLVARGLWSHFTRRYTMGPGFVHDLRTGRTISSDDAILFARPAWVTPLGKGQYVRADLLGPDVRLRLGFVDPSSPAFLEFWRRWCHPRPRPELKGMSDGEADRPGTTPSNVGD